MNLPAFRDLFRFSTKEIELAFPNRHKRGVKIPGLKLVSSKETSIGHGKLLVITPRAAGNAVKRNLMRRRIKSIYYQQKLYQNLNYHILIVYKEAVLIPYKDLEAFLISAIRVESHEKSTPLPSA